MENLTQNGIGSDTSIYNYSTMTAGAHIDADI